MSVIGNGFEEHMFINHIAQSLAFSIERDQETVLRVELTHPMSVLLKECVIRTTKTFLGNSSRRSDATNLSHNEEIGIFTSQICLEVTDGHVGSSS